MRKKLLDGHELRRAVQEDVLVQVQNGVLTVKTDAPGMHIHIVLEKSSLKKNKRAIGALAMRVAEICGAFNDVEPGLNIADLMKGAEGVKRPRRKVK